MERLELSIKTADSLNLLAAMLKTRSRAGLTDANHCLETIVKLFFNALFGWNLENLNTILPNYPAADLGDANLGDAPLGRNPRSVAIQVTNQASSSKIGDTQEKARTQKLNKKFKRLIIFFLLPKKPSLPRNFTQLTAGPKIETWDITDILKLMLDSDLKALRKAAIVLDEEMNGVNSQLRAEFNLEKRPQGVSRPILMARFHVADGVLSTVKHKRKNHVPPEYKIDLWIEGAPGVTESVNFEILDKGFNENPWSVQRKNGSNQSPRDFLTTDLNSWGDVVILAKGRGQKNKELWFIESTLYQALIRDHDTRKKTPEIKRALKQILDN